MSEKGNPRSAAKAAKRNEIANRRRQVAALVLARVPQYEIAEKLGVVDSIISADMKAVRQEWARERQADVALIQSRELAALDADESVIRRKLAGLAQDEHVARCKYYELILKYSDRRAKLLGTDAPTKIEARVDTTIEDRRRAVGSLEEVDRQKIADLAAKAYGPRPSLAKAIADGGDGSASHN